MAEPIANYGASFDFWTRACAHARHRNWRSRHARCVWPHAPYSWGKFYGTRARRVHTILLIAMRLLCAAHLAPHRGTNQPSAAVASADSSDAVSEHKGDRLSNVRPPP